MIYNQNAFPLGECGAFFVNEEKEAGYYTIEFTSAGLSSGVYFYSLTTGNPANGIGFSSIKKFVLMK